MAEKSVWWTTGATGDGASEYTQAEAIRVWRQQWLGDNTAEGVHPNYLNELEVTGTASPVSINTGAALVYGFPYWNSAAVTKTIATPSASTRVDRVVLRANWTAQTVRIEVLTGTEGVPTPPTLTQSDGATWEISLAEVSITTGGVITVTDDRSWVHANIRVNADMLDAAIAGDGLQGGDGSALAVGAGDGIDVAADSVAVDVDDLVGAGIESDGANNFRIAAAAAGDGLKGGGGSALAVEPNDFAGAGLEDDGADNLRIAAAAAGDGLQGGSGSALAVDVSDFAGTGLEDDGSENLRIAVAAAGDGLVGGGGSALAVNPDNVGIEISADAVQLKDEGHGPSKHANRQRTFFVPFQTTINLTDSTFYLDLDTGSGWPKTPDNKFSVATGAFVVPDDYVSGLQVQGIYSFDFGASGNYYCKCVVNTGYCGGDTQARGQASSGWLARPVLSADYLDCIPAVTAPGTPQAGDIINLSLQRDATNAADTANSDLVMFVGWKVTYTADE
jgi:hypothetical protein